MSSILGSERKPNATARCEQLIVDGSLQVAGMYIDGTAAGGGVELAAISAGNATGPLAYDRAVYKIDVDASATIDQLAIIYAATGVGLVRFNGNDYELDEDADKVVRDLTTIDGAADAGTLRYDGAKYVLDPLESYLTSHGAVFVGQDAAKKAIATIGWKIAAGGGTSLTIGQEGETDITVGGVDAELYLVEAVINFVVTEDLAQILITAHSGAAVGAIKFSSSKNAVNVVTLRFMIEGAKVFSIRFDTEKVTVEASRSNISARRIR